MIDSFVVDQWIGRTDLNWCPSAPLVRFGKRSKMLYTFLGQVDLEWTRLRCKSYSKHHHPLKKFFGLDRYQTKSSELAKLCIEVVSEDSYRKIVGKITNSNTLRFNHRILRWE